MDMEVKRQIDYKYKNITGKYNFKFTKSEKALLRLKKKIKCSDWAEKYRFMSMSSVSKTNWKNIITPYLVDVMDAAQFSSVNTIVLCKAPQVGGSEVANNWLAYAIDRLPGAAMFVYPSEETAKDNSLDRIIPMIRHSPVLKRFLTGYEDDISINRIKLTHMVIYFSWATSVSKLSNKPIRHLIFDETDKYPRILKYEADPISLGEKRTNTYTHNKMIWKISTPTTEDGIIWQAMNECHIIFDLFVKCPYCQSFQKMIFDNIKWDTKDIKKLEQEKSAYYLCKDCKKKWTDEKRNQAVRCSEWRSRDHNNIEIKKYLKKYRPLKIGFHIPAYLSFFISLTDCAVSFLKSQGNKEKLKDFMNNIKAEPFKFYKQERKFDRLKKLKDDRLSGLVPGGNNVACLTASVDTQDNGFWYEIRAWGYGSSLSSWQIRSGFVRSFDYLEQVLWVDTYKDVDSNIYPIQMSVIDAMGHKTSQVYDFCRMHRDLIYPLKGEQRMSSLYSYTNIEFYPGTKKPL